MIVLSLYISVTLNVNGLTSLIKNHTVAREILKNKTWLYTAYKRLMSALRRHTGSKWKDGRRYSMQEETKRAKMAISDKIDFKPETVTRDKGYLYEMSTH